MNYTDELPSANRQPPGKPRPSEALNEGDMQLWRPTWLGRWVKLVRFRPTWPPAATNTSQIY